MLVCTLFQQGIYHRPQQARALERVLAKVLARVLEKQRKARLILQRQQEHLQSVLVLSWKM